MPNMLQLLHLYGTINERGYRERKVLMNKLVMIVDDSPTVRKIIETSLRREGFESVSYSDGIEALRAITEQRMRHIPDLVILDIGLPKMDGYEFARRLKTKPQFNNTVIVMLTSRDRVIDRLKGRLAGAKEDRRVHPVRDRALR